MSTHPSGNDSTAGDFSTNGGSRHPDPTRTPSKRWPKNEVEETPREKSAAGNCPLEATSSIVDLPPGARPRLGPPRVREKIREPRETGTSAVAAHEQKDLPVSQDVKPVSEGGMRVERRVRSEPSALRHTISSEGFSNPVTSIAPVVLPVDLRHEKTPRNPSPPLSAIMEQGANLSNLWDSTEPAAERVPLPSGFYEGVVIKGQRVNSRRGTPGYSVTFKIKGGEHDGQLVWADCWLTEAAMKYTRRDLNKLGIHDIKQLDEPLQKGIHCRLQVVIHTSDDGTQFNKVKSFEVIGIQSPEPDPFDRELTQIDQAPNSDMNDEGSDHDRV